MFDPSVTERPWGRYRLYAENMPCTVKKVIIEPWAALSLQYHEHRSQRYIVINPLIVEWSTLPVPVGMYERDAILDWYCSHRQFAYAIAGAELFFDRRVIHRPHNDSKDVASFFEIAYGHNDEEDIVRLADRYGRKYRE